MAQKLNYPLSCFTFDILGDSLPVKIRVETKIIIGGEDLGIVPDASGYYNGTVKWNINPRTLFWGGFSIPQNYFERAQHEELKIEVRVTVIDQFDREHRLLPQCWRWATDQPHPFWNLEPRSFTEWTKIICSKNF